MSFAGAIACSNLHGSRTRRCQTHGPVLSNARSSAARRRWPCSPLTQELNPYAATVPEMGIRTPPRMPPTIPARVVLSRADFRDPEFLASFITGARGDSSVRGKEGGRQEEDPVRRHASRHLPSPERAGTPHTPAMQRRGGWCPAGGQSSPPSCTSTSRSRSRRPACWACCGRTPRQSAARGASAGLEPLVRGVVGRRAGRSTAPSPPSGASFFPGERERA